MSDVIYNISSGFFDSVNGDRLYSAADMNKPYKRVIADGIFPTPQGTPSTDFQVVAVSGMSVAVLAGNAMIGARWAENTDDVGITIAGNSSSSPRIDSIFLHIDTGMDTRAAGVVYRQGTAAGTPTAPAMVRTDNITELRLADILVAPSAAIITQANITDQRGGSECPWVAGLIQQVDTSALFDQYRAAYAEQQQEQTGEWRTFMDHLARDYDISMSLRKHESTYTSTAAASLIPIQIDGYDTTHDLLQVFINGVFAIEGTHYIIKSAAQIQLTNAISSGQNVHFVVYKAVMGGAQPIIPTDEQVQDAVDAYMDAHPGALVVDPELSDTSTHAIQNKAVAEALAGVNGRLQRQGVLAEYLADGKCRIYPEWEIGAINNAGEDEASTAMVRCSAILLNPGDKFVSSVASLRVFIYDLNGTYMSTLYSVTPDTENVMTQPLLVRFRAAYNDSLTPDYFDQYLTVSKSDKTASTDKRLSELAASSEAVLPNVYTASFSFVNGGINVSNGVDSTQANRARSGLFFVPSDMYIRSTNDGYTFRVIEYDSYGNFIRTINNSNVSSQAVAKGWYKILVFPVDESITDMTDYLTEITASIWCREEKHVYIVSKDGIGDFDDIQTALDFATHARAAYPVTIFVEPGAYDPISTITQKKYVTSIPNTGIKYYNRHISIIGRNEKTCIIKGVSGEYYYPAAEINVTGIIKNLTIISTHDTPPANKTDDTKWDKHKAYAVHSDYGTEDVLYEDCTLISYQAPAIGIGGATNKKIRIRRCHLYSYAPADGEYSPLVNYGGLFYHLQPAAGITGQYFELEDSYVYSENGDKSAWITPSSGTDYEQVTKLLRNCFYGPSCGKTVSIDSTMLSADSYGNNTDAANTALD